MIKNTQDAINILDEKRKQEGLSAYALSKKCGISEVTASRYFKRYDRHKNMPLHILLKISDALGFEVELNLTKKEEG